MFLGLSPRLEGEEMEVSAPGFAGGDRTDLELPAMQQRLLEAVTATGKPVVLVLMSGSALAVNWAQQHVPAILQAWYPGQAAGTAIADVLFGDYNPSGRLPITFYRSVADLPPFDDYSMAGRTYRYFTGTPLYPFGHGLSYTTFEESTPLFEGDQVRISVKNTGAQAGEHVIAVYSQTMPRELVAFSKVALAPGESKTITLVQYHRNNE
jgi:beta-glucosidase